MLVVEDLSLLDISIEARVAAPFAVLGVDEDADVGLLDEELMTLRDLLKVLEQCHQGHSEA